MDTVNIDLLLRRVPRELRESVVELFAENGTVSADESLVTDTIFDGAFIAANHDRISVVDYKKFMDLRP